MKRAAVLTLSLWITTGPACGQGKKAKPKRTDTQPKAAKSAPNSRPARAAPKPASRPAVATKRPVTPSPRPARKCWKNGWAVHLQVKRQAKRSPWGRLTTAQRATLVKRAAFMKRGGVLQKFGAQFAAAWSHCPGDGDTCYLYAGLASGESKLRNARKVLLGKGWRDSDIGGSALFDVDDDGKPEFLVYFTSMAESQAAVGSSWERSLAILTLPGLKLQGAMSMGSGGSASIHTVCKVTLRRADLRCTGHPQIIESVSCQEQICDTQPSDAACTAGPKLTTQIYPYDNRTDRYLTALPLDLTPKFQPIRSGHPWLVIVASFEADEFNSRIFVDRFRAKLARKSVTTKVYYSSAFAKLRPRFWVLVAGRFKTRAEASQHRRSLRKSHVPGYIKKGF